MKNVVEYIWIDGDNGFRSKARVLNLDITNDILKQLPVWNYDGSSTKQAEGHYSEVVIKPCAVFKDPFRKKDNYLVICDTYRPNGIPLENNYRPNALEIFNKKLDEEPWFGIEQEYFLINPHTNLPLGFPNNGFPKPQGPYYCGIGANHIYGRDIVEKHLEYCLYAGITISGINAEVACGQWEYQIGPCVGIDSGDQLMVSRYILERIAEDFGVFVSIKAKPIIGDWNGSGCHTNYSTKSMREGTEDKCGLDYIYEAIQKLEPKHAEHMAVYGSDNRLRMTGKHETASFDKFTSGCANRGASVRIGNDVVRDKKGYFEDRRPSADMNPYLVTSKLFETTILL